MEKVKINDEHEFSTYPTNRVCAIMEKGEDARDALGALLRNEIPEDHIDIFYGSAGILIFDAKGENHGFSTKIAKQLRAYGDLENDALRNYQIAMEEGGYLFEVLAESDVEKETIHRVLIEHKAHQINYFGSWYVEAMTEA